MPQSLVFNVYPTEYKIYFTALQLNIFNNKIVLWRLSHRNTFTLPIVTFFKVSKLFFFYSFPGFYKVENLPQALTIKFSSSTTKIYWQNEFYEFLAFSCNKNEFYCFYYILTVLHFISICYFVATTILTLIIN